MALSKGNSNGKSSVVDMFATKPTNGGKRIRMTINPEAMPKIMDRLTDLYDEPISSTVREVMSNALDATAVVLERGDKAEPVKITSPSTLNNYFVVEDNGVGMSPETVEQVFANYGGSTKGDAFNQVGAFGLGAKAPLAYCDEFYFTTTHNGVTSEVAVSRFETGPETNILSVTQTGLPSGTVVRIPVKNTEQDYMDFKQNISLYKTFAFTMEQPLVVDGDFVSEKQDDFHLMGEILLDQDENLHGKVWFNKSAVMDILSDSGESEHIYQPLRVDYVLSGYLYSGYIASEEDPHIVVELKPGLVQFSSSRENITKDDVFYRFDSMVKAQIKDSNLFENALVNYYKSLADDSAAYKFLKLIRVSNNDPSRVVMSFRVQGWDRSGMGMMSSTRFGAEYSLDEFTTVNGYNPFMEEQKFEKSANIIGAFERMYYSQDKLSFLNARHERDSYGRDVDISTAPAITTIKNKMTTQLGQVMSNNSLKALEHVAKAFDKRAYEEEIVHVIFGVDDEKKIGSIVRLRTKVPSSRMVLIEEDISEELQKIMALRLDKYGLNAKILAFSDFVKAHKKKREVSAKTVEKDAPLKVQALVLDELNSLQDIQKLANGKLGMREHVEVASKFEEGALFIPVEHASSSIVADTLNGMYHAGEKVFGRPVLVVIRPRKDFFELVKDPSSLAVCKDYTPRSALAEERLNGRVFQRSLSGDALNSMSDELRIAAHYLYQVERVDVSSTKIEETTVLDMLKAKRDAIERFANYSDTSGSLKILMKFLTNVIDMDYNNYVHTVPPRVLLNGFEEEEVKSIEQKRTMIDFLQMGAYRATYTRSKATKELASSLTLFEMTSDDEVKNVLGKRVEFLVDKVLKGE